MSVTSSIRATIARTALEQVCSGARLSSAAEFYSPNFVDHVNGANYLGHEGIRRSVQRYGKFLSNLRINVIDQLVDTDRIASRFTVRGTCYGREVSFAGITISRFDGQLIAEDWSVTDSLGMLKGLGFWRCLLLALKA